MDKKELKQDIVRDRLIEYIDYLADNSTIVFQVIIGVCVLIGAYSFFAIKGAEEDRRSAELYSFAQQDYNEERTDFTVSELQSILDDFEGSPGAAYAYIYMIYDSYVNNDANKLDRLLSDYSNEVDIDDALLSSSSLETISNIYFNREEYDEALEKINKALKTENIYSLRARFSIGKAMIYIDRNQYEEAKQILNVLKEENTTSSQDKNKVEELLSYIEHSMK